MPPSCASNAHNGLLAYDNRFSNFRAAILCDIDDAAFAGGTMIQYFAI